ncbi:MAG: DUF2283 domain-containing protein [Candidatus Sumerlaeota bacterium]|nr:DUF2283 domain-containing protein [Candidatus Sumerlaeota bacterium]
MIKVVYDPEVDVRRIRMSSAAIGETNEDKPGVILDYEKDGNVAGVEIPDDSKRVKNPRTLEHAVAG